MKTVKCDCCNKPITLNLLMTVIPQNVDPRLIQKKQYIVCQKCCDFLNRDDSLIAAYKRKQLHCKSIEVMGPIYSTYTNNYNIAYCC